MRSREGFLVYLEHKHTWEGLGPSQKQTPLLTGVSALRDVLSDMSEG